MPNSTTCADLLARLRASKSAAPSRAAPLAALYRRAIAWSFDRFYGEASWSYPAVAWLVSRGYWHRWTLAALPYLRGRVLETGCGTGYVQAALAQRAPERASVVGLDASPHMLAHTRRRLRRHALPPPRLCRARAQALPFARASFDTVLATFPSEYIIDPRTLADIRRVLAPRGRFVVVDAARFTTSGVYETLVDLAYRVTFQASVQRAPAAIPYRCLVEQAGFAVAEHEEPVGASVVTVMVATPLADTAVRHHL